MKKIKEKMHENKKLILLCFGIIVILITITLVVITYFEHKKSQKLELKNKCPNGLVRLAWIKNDDGSTETKVCGEPKECSGHFFSHKTTRCVETKHKN